jgi:hypothetical protein
MQVNKNIFHHINHIWRWPYNKLAMYRDISICMTAFRVNGNRRDNVKPDSRNRCWFTGCPTYEHFATRELSVKLLRRNVCLLNIVSIDSNTSLESLHPSEKSPIQGNFVNAPQDVLDCVKRCTPIGPFVSSEELPDVTGETEIRQRQIGRTHWVRCFVIPFCSRKSKLILAGWGVPYRHGQSTFDRL